MLLNRYDSNPVLTEKRCETGMKVMSITVVLYWLTEKKPLWNRHDSNRYDSNYVLTVKRHETGVTVILY